MKKLAISSAVATACAVFMVPLLAALVVMAISAPAAAEVLAQQCNTAMADGVAPTAAGQLRLVQANEFQGLSAQMFDQDVTNLVSSGPDFLTLNETSFRTNQQLRPPGYLSWRADTPVEARETPVLWRTDRWTPLTTDGQGTILLHASSLNGGTRYANWVSLQSTADATGRVLGRGV